MCPVRPCCRPASSLVCWLAMRGHAVDLERAISAADFRWHPCKCLRCLWIRQMLIGKLTRAGTLPDRWRPGKGAARGVHDLQLHRHRGGVLAAGPQVRPHVRQARLRALVSRPHYPLKPGSSRTGWHARYVAEVAAWNPLRSRGYVQHATAVSADSMLWAQSSWTACNIFGMRRCVNEPSNWVVFPGQVCR